MERTVNLPNLCENLNLKEHIIFMWSVSRTDCKWIGTQPEVNRNILYSTNKHCYPSISQWFQITEENTIYP